MGLVFLSLLMPFSRAADAGSGGPPTNRPPPAPKTRLAKRVPTPTQAQASKPINPWEVILTRVPRYFPLPVAAGGDVNGDGLSDLVIGAPFENESTGRMMVFYGSTNGLGQEPDWVCDGQRKGQQFGNRVAVLDVNGDGISDAVAAQWEGEYSDTNDFGGLFVFLGTRQGLSPTPFQTIPNRIGPYGLRRQPKSAGDVNGDGCDDLAVEIVEDGLPTAESRSIAVFYGSTNGLSPRPDWVRHGEPNGWLFGHDFESAGDVNNDGYGDFIAGDMKYSGKYPRCGKAYLFLGGPTGLQREPAWTSEYPVPRSKGDWGMDLFFSNGLAGAGDVNKDGFGDVIVGAWLAAHGDVEEGAACLFLGSRTGLSAKPVWIVEGNHARANMGRSVSSAGDVDGDGYADVMVGVPEAVHHHKEEGVVLIYRGTPTGLADEPTWVYEGERSGGKLGELVANSGDVNGDGFPDLLMAGPDTAHAGEPLLRLKVVFGPLGPKRLAGLWSPVKTPLVVLEQSLERVSSRTLWLSGAAGLVVVVGVLLLVQRKLRRQLAGVIAQNRQLAAAQERTRIARDIHDHLGADLTQLAVQLDRAAGSDSPPLSTQAAALPDLRNSARKAVKTLDELVWATDPRQDKLEGLADYLAEFAPNFLEAHGHACELDLPVSLPAIPLSSRLRHNLFLIAKEALRNAVQHAGAGRVRVALEVKDRALELTVEDDGRGLPGPQENGATSPSPVGLPGTAKPGRGNGLTNMNARAEEMGGRLSITTPPSGGTKVSVAVLLPVEVRKEDQEPS